jgi:ABC-2 type transport system permease protein
MRNVWIIARREYKRFFTSPVAYIVAAVFLFLLGYFFLSDLIQAINYSVYYQAPAPGAEIVTGQWMVILLIFAMPAITMRSVSEELRMGTMELLLTSPVKDWELIVGKWLGAFLFMVSLLAITLILPLILNFLVTPGIDKGIMLTGYIGLILMVASLVAMGIFISSLFSNQVVVFFITFFFFLFLYFVLRPLGSDTGGTGSQILTNLNFIQHYINFFQGTIDLKDVFYYLSITALALLFGTVAIEVRRWS